MRSLKLSVVVGKAQIMLEIEDRSYAMTPQIAERLSEMLTAGVTKLKGVSA